ncbi:MAG: hypothetical protein L0I88_06340 [Alkalibacterium sp.]|nr:hypothetical protein [Alkalibacterium sp.]
MVGNTKLTGSKEVDTPTAKAMGFFSTKPYASISSLYLPKDKGYANTPS